MVVLNNEIKLILTTHLMFYRRHPWLIALFLLGFSLGSALLTAIAGFNQEAKTRYQASAALINNPVTYLIKPLMGKQYIDGNLWIRLKRAGIVNAQPVLRGRLTTHEGQHLAIQGVDTLQWLMHPQYRQQYQQSDVSHSLFFSLEALFVDPQFLERLDTATKHSGPFVLKPGQRQPDIRYVNDIGLWAITDLAFADDLLQAKGRLSFIELSNVNEAQLAQIVELIAGKARLIEAQQQVFDVLSEAFFFNLAALAMLGYIVAAFLSFNAIKLTLVARKRVLKQLHLLGCTALCIKLSLIVELIMVSLVTALLGTIGGYFIANGLVLDVNQTLMSLYQLDKALVIHWQWSNVLLGFTLNIFALAIILLAQTQWVVRQSSWVFYSLLVGGAAGFIWLFHFAVNEYQALLLCFTLLLLFILLVPRAISALVSLPLHFTHPLAQWLHADTRWHIKDLYIAIIAILVALGSAIGMQIMVLSFSHSLNAHLEKQLSADIYLRSNTLDSHLRQMLSELPEVTRLSIYMRSDGEVDSIPAHLSSFGNNIEHYQHLSLTSGLPIREANLSGEACLANEQSHVKYGVTLGSVVVFEQNATHFRCRITGFFYDYGNPSILLLTLENRHQTALLNKVFLGYSIHLNHHTPLAAFSERLIVEFNQDSTTILPNKRIKQYATDLFDDTFVVTKALNGFILAIALLSLCTSLLSLSANQLKQLMILHQLGVTQRQLLTMKLVQTTGVVSVTALFAIPLGLALGLALLTFVMPIAFGWSIHFYFDLYSLVLTCFTLVGVSVACAYLPISHLTHLKEW
ncbi:FtsX-like permease family protein [uncultured Shewanella sp.]|uniref:FtsX-like permease family protein n=1 Tax=uncultured Shewanella sp. TaxID=173975 RepID=UPI002611B42A|nr:FtsX-like permease family protein [uncultured Shewanella sp.]